MRQKLSLPLDRTAAVFVDLQEEHRRDERFLCEGFDQVVANAARLQLAARRAGVPLFHYAYAVDPETIRRERPFHPMTEDGRSAFSDRDDPRTAVCAEVAPQGDEPLIVKAEASAFGAGLGRDLKERGIEWLIVSGVWTEACVDATVKDALRLGFRVLLVKDACGSGTETMHRTGILNLANRLYGGAVCDTKTACRLLAGESAEAWQAQGAVPIRYGLETVSSLYRSL